MNEKDFMGKWQERSSKIEDIKELPSLLEEMLQDANDYGSIARCLGLGANATARAMDRHNNGGITGFQSGFVMWTFIREWMYSNNQCGLKLVDYDNMLYPQYEYKFEKTISKDIWENLQKQAKENLSKDTASPSVMNHWKSIAEGNIPFGYTISED